MDLIHTKDEILSVMGMATYDPFRNPMRNELRVKG